MKSHQLTILVNSPPLTALPMPQVLVQGSTPAIVSIEKHGSRMPASVCCSASNEFITDSSGGSSSIRLTISPGRLASVQLLRNFRNLLLGVRPCVDLWSAKWLQVLVCEVLLRLDLCIHAALIQFTLHKGYSSHSQEMQLWLCIREVATCMVRCDQLVRAMCSAEASEQRWPGVHHEVRALLRRLGSDLLQTV
jgi:hypothetical protein